MRATEQVISYELATRLKNMGVEQEAAWGYNPAGHVHTTGATETWTNDWTAAFSVAELGEMLPWDIVIHRNIYKHWTLTYQANGEHEGNVKGFQGENEAEVRCLMLIYLLENNLISL